ncbi:MAG: UDP-N-acetylmuramoyl-L-alanyl-D-glutamate--2,6-diaminopimelate ligase [Gammaproteobacteria bacterium]|nr:UDP-N-acetylmuramoyl-L-alanyl-D-glutamate--2,6-diaminopimelate ligase [Gammaproteobacteria bacterium]
MARRLSAPVRELAVLLGVAAPDCALTGLSLDSRRIAPGALFLACRGTRAHGLEYLDQALANGAAAVAWEPAPGVAAPTASVPTVAVPGLGAQVSAIASRFYGQPSLALDVIGVTGTDGKTSIAYLLAQALDTLGVACGYVGTLGHGRIICLDAGDQTTPDPVTLQRWLAEAADAGCAAVAIEVSSHALDQRRTDGVHFATRVLSNVGRDHLDYHGSEVAYAAAKRRLFDGPGSAILNLDDARGRAWAGELDDVIGYGVSVAPQGRHVLARDLHFDLEGLAFTAYGSFGEIRIASRLLGRFNVDNLLAVLAVLLSRGTHLESAAEALAACRTVPGRMEGFRAVGGGPLLIVDYAHTPQALRSVLSAARAHCTGELSCVFGCGGDRDRGKRPLMGAVAAELADHLVVTDDNPRSEDPTAITTQILQGVPAGLSVPVVHERADAIAQAIASAGAADVIVVAGKGHEDYQIVGNQRRDFSDRRFVAEQLGLELRA